MMSHDEQFIPATEDEQVDYLFEQQNASTVREAHLIKDLYSIYEEDEGIRDRVKERLIKSIADKAAMQQSSLEHKRKGGRPSIINFEERKHQMRGLNLYTERHMR